MQTLIPASVAATVPGRHAWLKNAARAAFLFFMIKGTTWLAASWLAFRGFNGL